MKDKIMFMATTSVEILNNEKSSIIGVVHNLDELVVMNNNDNNSLGSIIHYTVNSEFNSRERALDNEALIEFVVLPIMSVFRDKLKMQTRKLVCFELQPFTDCISITLTHKEIALRLSYTYDIQNHRNLLSFEMALLPIN